MRVLYFGTYERDYPRNTQVISCLRSAGVEVAEHHISTWEGTEHKFGLGPRSAARLAFAELRLLRRPAIDFDVLIVGYPGHADIPAAKRIARGRPVVFNPLVSLEDTLVADRGIVRSASLKARVLSTVDRVAFRGADAVVADTAAHARYYGERFGLDAAHVGVCFVGAEDRLFHPEERHRDAHEMLFVGKLIPLHGVQTILDAAALCPDLRFRIVGTGQDDAKLAARSPNVVWEPWAEYECLPELYRAAGCALGIFGTSSKAARVIPNKAFHSLATATPLITADTPAARELLEDERDALLVPAGDAEALAAAVRRLASDSELRVRLAARGRATYEQHASEEVLGRQWRSLVEGLVDTPPRR